MVLDNIIGRIKDALEAVGLSPEQIQKVIEAIQDGARDLLVDLLNQFDVPQFVIDFILSLL